MSKLKTYEYLVTMPAKFNWYMIGWKCYDVDLYNNPDGENEHHLLQSFYTFFGKDAFSDSIRFTRITKIAEVLEKYNYKLDHDYDFSITKDTVSMKLVIKTNAVRQHLEIILDEILNEYFHSLVGCDEWVREAKIKKHGWQNLDFGVLETCEHNYNRLQIMNDKNGSIVEVLECTKCKELAKREVGDVNETN